MTCEDCGNEAAEYRAVICEKKASDYFIGGSVGESRGVAFEKRALCDDCLKQRESAKSVSSK